MSRSIKLRMFAIAVVAFAVPCSFNLLSSDAAERKALPANPNIDMEGYLAVSKEAATHRTTRRLSEADFIKLAGEEGTIVLDARSKEKFDLLHIKGAVNLSFPDITIESLAKAFPNKEARILIYCNNNFLNSEEAFPSKAPRASLNLSTYIALYSYGYRNIYELAPRIDPKVSKLTFETKAK